ncbi:hypothetical protein NE237_012184 [Protea cynaroides]|uniref:Uncharacterized protein n=1 Tax=Protea cynaroides TaxID=273540 RepID=A0A9Q0GWB0_9MAGN|nr:hypothetical protein NE237_012184 [Protea cynaroides]
MPKFGHQLGSCPLLMEDPAVETSHPEEVLEDVPQPEVVSDFPTTQPAKKRNGSTSWADIAEEDDVPDPINVVVAVGAQEIGSQELLVAALAGSDGMEVATPSRRGEVGIVDSVQGSTARSGTITSSAQGRVVAVNHPQVAVIDAFLQGPAGSFSVVQRGRRHRGHSCQVKKEFKLRKTSSQLNYLWVNRVQALLHPRVPLPRSVKNCMYSITNLIPPKNQHSLGV